MDGWIYGEFGDPARVLRRAEVPVPVAGDGQVLISVEATAVNFADCLVIEGAYQFKPPLPAVAGTEVAGTVVGAGAGEEHLLGTRVAGMTPGMAGGFARFAVLDLVDACPVPADYSPVEAAAFPVASQTAWFALHRRGGLQRGDVVLVHAAAGGVGSAAVQLAKAAGAIVIGTVGSAGKRAVATRIGCDLVVLRDDPDAVAIIREWSPTGAVDVVVDPVGGSAHALSEKVVAFEGRIVVVGFAAGEFPRLRAEHALVKNYSIVGTHWGLYRSRRPDLVVSERERLLQTMEAAGIRPFVTDVVDFDGVPNAIGRVSGGASIGRVVVHQDLRVGSEET